jgi:AraC family L-rhamnose operon regulatory protein RhaS
MDFPFYIAPYSIKPNWNSPHKHEFVECVFVTDGVGEHIYKGNSQPISKGDFFIIEPNEEHGYRVNGKDPVKVYNILFLPVLLEAELRSLSEVAHFVRPLLSDCFDFQYHLKLSVNEGLELKHLLDRMFNEYKKKPLGYRSSIKALLMELLISLCRCHERQVSQPLASARDESNVIAWICEFTRLHYAQPIMLEQIYQMCGMSAAAFTSKFKQKVGKTYTEYRNDVRIEISCDLLRKTDKKVIHICQEVGFNDVSHYNKAFKQFTGMTPSQYRSNDVAGNIKP